MVAVRTIAVMQGLALYITRSFFCIGAAVVYLLPDGLEEGEKNQSSRVNWYCKAGEK